VVSDLEGMLRRLMVGHVELVTALEPEPGLVKVDPGQIEQVLMNLVVNARDAMPNGGTITIRTENVLLDAAYCENHTTAQPGPHLMLAVADTGHGMDEATVRRVFEPFFTTKELGRGTGLGLSTVYGIVKQSGGHIWVYSEVGHGTVFKIYFPLEEGAAAKRAAESGPATSRTQGSETVLLVDDEETLRIPVRRFLEKRGYTILEAGSGADALQVCGEHEGPIDLVITDMMMPGMHGRELMEHVMHVRPAAKVLFTSGYADDQMIKRGLLDADMAFIQKPFNLGELEAKIRDVLTRRATA
jgi:two-component system cell cycle sensor histidine kinase/response regulator CckA